MKPEGSATEKKVLDRIERSYSGLFEKAFFQHPKTGKLLRRYWLVESGDGDFTGS